MGVNGAVADTGIRDKVSEAEFIGNSGAVSFVEGRINGHLLVPCATWKHVSNRETISIYFKNGRMSINIITPVYNLLISVNSAMVSILCCLLKT